MRVTMCAFQRTFSFCWRKRERKKPRQRVSARGKKEVAGGDTRVSKDVMRERNGERERNAM